MRLLKAFAFALCLGFVPAQAPAQEPLTAQVIGTWREYSPSDNLIEFARDGALTLYLKKGEVADLHSLRGLWWVEDNSVLVAIIVRDGQKQRTSAFLAFEGGEMILTDGWGKETRHRRHKGPIPDEWRW